MSYESQPINDKYELKTLLDSQKWIDGESFGRSHLVEAALSSITFYGTKFQNLQSLASLFMQCRFVDVEFKDGEFIHTRFENCYFRNVHFNEAVLRHVQFESCVFESCKFSFMEETANGADIRYENTLFHNTETPKDLKYVQCRWLDREVAMPQPTKKETKAAAPAPVAASQTPPPPKADKAEASGDSRFSQIETL